VDKKQILGWLKEESPAHLANLYYRSDRVRKKFVGDEVHLRGLAEISNHCRRSCAYCGISVMNKGLKRYRMKAEEILACAQQAAGFGFGTLVMQAGEDEGIKAEWIADIIREVKARTPLAVTLSLGERSPRELALWRRAGADRYLLRFETSDERLYKSIHPPAPGRHVSDRIKLLRRLRESGYEIGSGVMVGIPGQTYESLADDILLFKKLDLDMVGIGPYLPHPDTPLGKSTLDGINPANQVPNSEDMVYKTIALTRLLCPETNIPSTTALATINREAGRELGLSRGANIVMPNLTPLEYRRLYEIYPAKACIFETPDQCQTCLQARIHSIGRNAGTGPGSRRGITIASPT
jgi:biotin synthase